MKLLEINSSSLERESLDHKLRVAIKESLDAEKCSVNEVLYIVTRLLPELAERSFVEGHLIGAYTLATRPPHLRREHAI